ncbi:hypothetical protein EGW08_005656, partial [Elysia chlorotica]
MLVSTVARTLVLIGMTMQVASVIRPTLLGKIPFRSPGFINLIEVTSSSGQKYNLVISSSQPYNQVGLVKDIGSLLNSVNTISPDVINTGLLAPNLISGVPDSALGASEPYIAIPSGFLDPDRRDGTITLQPLRDGAETVLTQPNQEWFYSKVQWVDMNKDGFLDVVTSESHSRSFGEIDGELVYLTNPQSGRLTNQWAEMFIGNGPDMFFTHTTVQVALALKEVIITADFYNAKLQVFWTESLTDDWSDQTLV